MMDVMGEADSATGGTRDRFLDSHGTRDDHYVHIDLRGFIDGYFDPALPFRDMLNSVYMIAASRAAATESPCASGSSSTLGYGPPRGRDRMRQKRAPSQRP